MDDLDDLGHIIANILTELVTRSLPESWTDSYSVERARSWIIERDEEGTILLVMVRSTQEPAGFVMLSESEADQDIEVRLDYLLAQQHWGKDCLL